MVKEKKEEEEEEEEEDDLPLVSPAWPALQCE